MPRFPRTAAATPLRSVTRSLLSLLSLLSLHAFALGSASVADTGIVRASQPIGTLLVTVFTDPTPLRAGAVEVSVMVQRRDDSAPVLDATVTVAARSHIDTGREWSAPAIRTGGNKLLYVAWLAVDVPGRTAFSVAVNARGDSGAVTFEADVGPKQPPVVAYWPYLVVPFVVIALYALNQTLRARGSRPA